MKLKNLVYSTILVAICQAGLNAQPNEGNPNFSPTPFGFVEILVVAGAALGSKKLYDRQRTKAE